MDKVDEVIPRVVSDSAGQTHVVSGKQYKEMSEASVSKIEADVGSNGKIKVDSDDIDNVNYEKLDEVEKYDDDLNRIDKDLEDAGKNKDELIEEEALRSNPFKKNGELKPNIKYKTGEYEYLYETDEMGRISKFETDDLKLTKRENRLKHDPDTPGKQKGDHAGHLAADRFGGSPKIDNLVSQSSDVNLSQYKRIENKWAKAIEEGKNVKNKVEVKYEGDSLRPSEFIVEYEIDGKYYDESIIN